MDPVTLGKPGAGCSITLRGLVMPACRAVLKARLLGHVWIPHSETGGRKL